MVNYRSKKTLLFLGLKYHRNLLSYCSNLPPFQGKFNVIYIPMVIYCHSAVITKLMLLYNTEWWYDCGIAVNYCCKKFYKIGPRCHRLEKGSWRKFSASTTPCSRSTLSSALEKVRLMGIFRSGNRGVLTALRILLY